MESKEFADADSFINGAQSFRTSHTRGEIIWRNVQCW